MTQQDWQRIRELFDRAVVMNGAERSEFVRTQCREDAEMLTELKKLLAADEANAKDGRLDSGSDVFARRESDRSGEIQDDDLPLAVGANVEGYLLEKVIGQGVSGVVYQAVRSQTKHRPVNAKAPSEHHRGLETTNGDVSVLHSELGDSVSDSNALAGFPNRTTENDDVTENRLSGDRVAIKALYRGSLDRDSVLRYDREREALARLRHPNIAKFIRAGKTDCGVPFLIMELIEGRSLHDVMEPGDESKSFDRTMASDNVPNLNQRLAWMIQIAEGVQSAHQKLILHRDLKPANVIINRAGDAVLTDFGLAKFLGPVMPEVSRTSIGKIMGTPQYMAPEQVLAQEPTMATDVYGLGGVLYFLLTGRPPFDRPSFYETCEAVKNEAPPPPSRFAANVPRDLERICLKCLAREPEKRYSSVDGLLSDLRSFSRGQPVAARPVSMIE